MRKVVIIGPESTGKSSLCAQLAEYYNTLWCPEYAREYLEKHGTKYTYDDLLLIAKGQLELEDALTKKLTAQIAVNNSSAEKPDLLFIDTNMYVMKVWCEYVFGKCHQFILDNIVERKYDLYLLCNIDIPWVPEELREYPDETPRRELFDMYKDILINQNTPWVEISGDYDERLRKAITATNNYL
jgi:NadR type nicotinamide-nucleotide adenylyltransferase